MYKCTDRELSHFINKIAFSLTSPPLLCRILLIGLQWVYGSTVAKRLRWNPLGKLNNFNFQLTKNLYQNNFNHIVLFLTLFEDYKCNKLYEITTKTFPLGAREYKLQKLQISQKEILHKTILHLYLCFLNSCEI